MTNLDSLESRSFPYETLQERSSSSRRARPPDITITGDENRIPLRERTPRRESRVGLKTLFTRTKPGKLDLGGAELSSSRAPGLRASLAEMSNWPYKLHSSRSEASLLSTPSLASRTSAGETPPPTSWSSKSRQGSSGDEKPLPVVPLRSRGTVAAWEPPPLFKAFPQAVQYTTLPACNVPVEALARANESNNASLSQIDVSANNRPVKNLPESASEKKDKTIKKKHRVTGSKDQEWTTKIYVLTTAGYLLQYCADGDFDRLPERVLKLTRDSAAFASDLLPGKHWVLQVVSSAATEANASADAKFLRSRLSTRGSEKKAVTSMLMVFEGPDDMDSWLATLRHEFELLGGKKKRSETGIVENGAETIRPREQTRQRNPLTRDTERCSRLVFEDFSWTQKNALVDPLEEEEEDVPKTKEERTSESTLDDQSTTTSFASSDGHHLDNLRENNHRLSYVSSGQRTILTSVGSSPASSPTRASFSSHSDEHISPSGGLEARRRPNAAAIMNRRQSMQTMVTGLGPDERPESTASNTSSSDIRHEYVSGPHIIPNFSVPHTANRRFSTLNFQPDSGINQSRNLDNEGSAKSFRRSPPTALALARPLSVVMDQPSPISPRSPGTLEAPDASSIFSQWPSYSTIPRGSEQADLPQRHSSLVPEQSADAVSPTPSRRSGSASRLRGRRADRNLKADLAPRASSSLGTYGPTSQLISAQAARNASHKRSSFIAEDISSQPIVHRSFGRNYAEDRGEGQGGPALSQKVSPKKRSLSSLRTYDQTRSSQVSSVDADMKTLAMRRSMPQLAEGPPPAPPPTCALPPIPSKHSNTSRAIRT